MEDSLPTDALEKCASSSGNNNKCAKPKKQREMRNTDVSLPYIEPEWSSSPPPNYKFEVIKNGAVIANVPINTPYITFGRLQTCSVSLEHPSVSRYHAILQFCPGDETRIKGFYVYDLGSTHGTFLNKKQITAKVYYKVDVGHILKFGGSTRLHIFQGPDEEVNSEVGGESKEAAGCSWGIGEDAEEEDDLSINPFALSTANEELYLNDPKKTLRGWFEREGYELEYKVEEKGFGTFVCRVQLPVDTPTGEEPVAEATVTGKKKEAVVACAMEACRILDRYGMLRQARQESRRKKRKNWEDEDYYDSDEDTFLDRTGTIEKKRELRKKIVKKTEVETFQSLSKKLESVNTEISEIEGKIQNCSASLDSCQDDDKDSLETYMSQLESSSTAAVDKVTKSKLKLQLSELLKEKHRLEKLLVVAKPTELPPVLKTFGIIGKRPTKKLQLPAPAETNKIDRNKIKELDSEEEEEDSEESDDAQNKQPQATKPPIKSETESVEDNTKTPQLQVGDLKNMEDNSPENLFHQHTSNKTSKTIPKDTKAQRKSNKPAVVTDAAYSLNDSDYSMWVPPNNQTGDGVTHLNSKYGY